MEGGSTDDSPHAPPQLIFLPVISRTE
jgi:hypothetical protein